MSHYFSADLQVNSHDCDLNNVLRPSGVLRYLQETANLHIENVGMGYDFLKNQGRAFILSRVAVVMHEPIYAYDRLTGRTWASGNRGVCFNRCSELIKDGRTAAELSSLWALLDVELRTLVRVRDAGVELPTGEELSLSAPLKFRIPDGLSLEKAGEFSVGYAVCDRNRHMNNTRYPDMLCDFMPVPTGKRLKELSISYIAEAPLGEKLEIFSAEEPGQDVYYFKTVRLSDGAENVLARISFTDL